MDLMLDREEMNYDDFTLRDVNKDELSGSLAPFTLLVIVLFLTASGFLVSYSASYDVALRSGSVHYFHFLEMVFFFALSFLTGVLVFFTKKEKLEVLPYVIYPISSFLLFFLSYLQITGKSAEVLPFPGINGCDALTFSTVLIVASAFPRIRNKERRGWWYLLISLLGTASILLMVVMGEYTYAFLYFATLLVLFYLARFSLRFIFFYALFNLTAFLFLFLMIPSAIENVFARIAFLNGESPDSERLIYSMNAIKEGGLLGKGVGNGYYKLGLIDGIEDDYVFANIAEELGILGAFIIFLLFLCLFAIGMRTSNRAELMGDEFISITAYGFTFVIVLKAFLSVFVTIGIFPSSGISMPFFSANGFELFFTILECAFLYRFAHITGRRGR